MAIKIIPYAASIMLILNNSIWNGLKTTNLAETHDLIVLDDPRGTILDRGGSIWLAEIDGEIVGTAGLVERRGSVNYELVKMTVDSSTPRQRDQQTFDSNIALPRPEE